MAQPQPNNHSSDGGGVCKPLPLASRDLGKVVSREGKGGREWGGGWRFGRPASIVS